MSRARPIELEDGKVWFDTKRNGEPADEFQLELLAATENVDLDELFEQGLTQGALITRLREAIGETIPPGVLAEQQKRRAERLEAAKCRKCSKEGDSTKHHFVNKWILRELDNYASKWADTRINTIPLCLECHRELHLRDETDKSIVLLLTEQEKTFVTDALTRLMDQKPRLVLLLARGDRVVYESQLVKDWINDKFDKEG